jgi:16S rRNA (cytosine967-C5)-methyltransferase
MNQSLKISPARAAAFDILRRVEEEEAFAAPLLSAARHAAMRREDRALLYELTLGTLRWQLWLDRLIEHYSKRPAGKLDASVRRALRLGLYQLRFLTRIPPSAIINEAVNFAHRERVRSAAGFINAVLRRAAREPAYDPTENITDEIECIAVKTSHPCWLIERWTKCLGAEHAKLFAESNNEIPPVAFRLGNLRARIDDVLTKIHDEQGVVDPSPNVPEAWRVRGASSVVAQLAEQGEIYLQDEASQLVAHILGAKAGERILDVCAAPGSKTTHIAVRARGEAFVAAGDVYAHRLRTLREMIESAALENVNPIIHNAETSLPFADKSFDRVLVDAPCTGTGTLRRNPEIRWRIELRDIEDLAARQKRILNEAARVVRPGGKLVYSTCSIEPEENEEVVADFLERNTKFALMPSAIPEKFLTSTLAGRTWPHRDGTDGFFIAAFEQIKN